MVIHNHKLSLLVLAITGWINHKADGRCALIVQANSFASTITLARSIEGASGMPPFLSALETLQFKLPKDVWRLEAR